MTTRRVFLGYLLSISRHREARCLSRTSFSRCLHFSKASPHLGVRMKRLCRCCCSRRWIHWSHIRMVSSNHSRLGMPETTCTPLMAMVGRI